MCGYTGYTLVLGSYLPSLGGEFSPATKKRLERARLNALCTKATLVVYGAASEKVSKSNPLSRAGYLRSRGRAVDFVSIKSLDLETEVREYLKLARRTKLETPTILGGAHEEVRVRLIAEYYFGEEMARKISFIAVSEGWIQDFQWFVTEPGECAKYLPKVWQRRFLKAMRAFSKPSA
jgi:hypothetical protein